MNPRRKAGGGRGWKDETEVARHQEQDRWESSGGRGDIASHKTIHFNGATLKRRNTADSLLKDLTFLSSQMLQGAEKRHSLHGHVS